MLHLSSNPLQKYRTRLLYHWLHLRPKFWNHLRWCVCRGGPKEGWQRPWSTLNSKKIVHILYVLLFLIRKLPP